MIVYLATPYSHPSAEVREQRFLSACEVAAWVMQQGHTVFCPIAHSHPIAAALPQELVLDHDFWMRQDLPLLHLADQVWVFPADAERTSRGVAREIKEARGKGIPVMFLVRAGFAIQEDDQ